MYGKRKQNMLKMLKKILKGEISLPILFWVFFFVPIIPYGLVFHFTFQEAFSQYTLKYVHIAMTTFVVYYLVISIALWNCARRYLRFNGQGIKKFFAYISGLTSILGLCAVALFLHYLIFVSPQDEILKEIDKIKMEISNAEQKDNHLTNVSYYDGIMNMYFTLDEKAIEGNKINTYLLCKLLGRVAFMSDPETQVNVITIDKNGDELEKVVFTYDKCKPNYENIGFTKPVAMLNKPPTVDKNLDELDKAILENVDYLNSISPTRVDTHIMIMGYSYHDKILYSYVALNIDANDPDYKEIIPVKRTVDANICHDYYDLAFKIDNTVTVTTVFSDSSGKEVDTVSYTYDECKAYLPGE